MYKGFKMKLYPGMEEEYERRHNLPGRKCRSIHNHVERTIPSFSILKRSTLYGIIWVDSEEEWAKQADDPINRKWWDYMADIMDTKPDNNSPVW